MLNAQGHSPVLPSYEVNESEFYHAGETSSPSSHSHVMSNRISSNTTASDLSNNHHRYLLHHTAICYIAISSIYYLLKVGLVTMGHYVPYPELIQSFTYTLDACIGCLIIGSIILQVYQSQQRAKDHETDPLITLIKEDSPIQKLSIITFLWSLYTVLNAATYQLYPSVLQQSSLLLWSAFSIMLLLYLYKTAYCDTNHAYISSESTEESDNIYRHDDNRSFSSAGAVMY